MTHPTLDLRTRILGFVQRFPGIHLRELAREAGLSEALAGYHVDALQDEHRLESRTDGMYRRLYPADAPAPEERDRTLMDLLRQPVPLELAVDLLAHGEATQALLAQRLRRAKSTISYHVRRLEAQGFLTTQGQGTQVRLAEPERVRTLLERWRPPRTMTDRFAGLWDRFYH